MVYNLNGVVISMDDNIAPQFSESTAYAAGAYVLKLQDNGQNVLYKFTAAHAAGAWTGTDVVAVTAASELADVKSQLNNKANVDGAYEGLTAGNAEQLVSTQGVVENSPYLFRTTGDTADVGNRMNLREILGGTVAVNQLMKGITQSSADGITTSYDSTTHKISVKNDSRTTNYSTGSTRTLFTKADGIISEHKYIVFGSNVLGIAIAPDGSSPATSMQVPCVIQSASTFALRVTKDYDFVNTHPVGDVTSFYLNITDLTLLLGPTIADYVYGLETATAGAGVAWLRKYFPMFFAAEYLPYNAGELISVSGLTEHFEVGFNAYNPETGTAELVGGNAYQITGTYTALSYSTGETIAPDADGKFTPSANGTLTVTGGNATDTCVHLVWSGTRDGEYEPYKRWSYPLDSSLTLRGIYDVDADGKPYVQGGDSYAPDGTIKRKAVQLVLNGTEAWANSTAIGDGTKDFRYFMTRVGDVGDVVSGKIISDKYITVNITTSNKVIGITLQNSTGYNRAQIVIRPENAATITTDELKAALAANPVTVVYLLAEPTTETATPYTELQDCDDWGTEGFTVDASAGLVAPPGTDSFYQANLRDKLQHLPNLASADGYYLIQQIGTQMVLVAFRIPQAPSTDGTYVLKATVSGGTPTYTWVDESASAQEVSA